MNLYIKWKLDQVISLWICISLRNNFCWLFRQIGYTCQENWWCSWKLLSWNPNIVDLKYLKQQLRNPVIKNCRKHPCDWKKIEHHGLVSLYIRVLFDFKLWRMILYEIYSDWITLCAHVSEKSAFVKTKLLLFLINS